MKKQRIDSTDSDEARSATVAPTLPSKLEGRLASYAMAAGAAGVGLLALAPAAKADIIYTPTHVDVKADNFMPFTIMYFPIDLNADGQAEFSFTAEYAFCAGHSCHGWWIGAQPASGNALAIGPLAPNYRIGPTAKFTGGAVLNTWVSRTYGRYHTSLSGGPWAHKTGYLGVRFLIDGQTHYGWVALSASRGTGQVTGYAYETVPDESIRAGQTGPTPEPGTLGLLALGSLGIAAWRRKKAVTSE